jgi:hypothetical protein
LIEYIQKTCLLRTRSDTPSRSRRTGELYRLVVWTVSKTDPHRDTSIEVVGIRSRAYYGAFFFVFLAGES